MNRSRFFLIGMTSACVIILIWQIAAIALDLPFILPNPYAVCKDILVLIKNPMFKIELFATFCRGLIAFSISLAFSIVLGFAAGINENITAILRPWMSIIKATPVVSFILIALLWFGSSKVPIFVSILMTMPVMTEAISQGVRSSDVRLLEMARMYHFNGINTLLHIRLPSSMPYFLAGAGSALGLTWKVVVAGEILSFPKYGIGTAMQTAKVHLETARVFSLTIAAIMLSIASEYFFHILIRFATRHTNKIKES